MNNSPYKPVGEIKFTEFNPMAGSRSRKPRKGGNRPPQANFRQLKAEYERLSRRLREIEKILGGKGRGPADQNPSRQPQSRGFRNNSGNRSQTSRQEKAPLNTPVSDVPSPISPAKRSVEEVDTKQTLGF